MLWRGTDEKIFFNGSFRPGIEPGSPVGDPEAAALTNRPGAVPLEDEKEVSSKRLQALGWKFRSAEETIRDTIDSYKAAGILK
ncbi:unnamed protein product [Urochloa humidicola]